MTAKELLDKYTAGERNFDRARLVGARLDRASLVGASLVGARLDRARLDRARLDRANLDGASLVGARLVGTCLDPKAKPNGHAEGFQSDRSKRGWVIGYRTRATSAAGCVLVDDRIYGCEVFSVADTECHPGWYLWPTLAQAKDFSKNATDFVRVRTRPASIHQAGAKWRAREIWVIGSVKEGGAE